MPAFSQAATASICETERAWVATISCRCLIRPLNPRRFNRPGSSDIALMSQDNQMQPIYEHPTGSSRKSLKPYSSKAKDQFQKVEIRVWEELLLWAHSKKTKPRETHRKLHISLGMKRMAPCHCLLQITDEEHVVHVYQKSAQRGSHSQSFPTPTIITRIIQMKRPIGGENTINVEHHYGHHLLKILGLKLWSPG